VANYRREDQQKLVANMSMELKKLQEQGKIMEMDFVPGESIKSINLWELMGENRLEFEKRITSSSPHAGMSVCIRMGDKSLSKSPHNRHSGVVVYPI